MKNNSHKSVFNVMSFVALIFIALLSLITNLLPLVGLNITGTAVNVLRTVQNVLILVIVGILGYNFTVGNAKWIKIVYWISLLVFVAGTVLLWFIK